MQPIYNRVYLIHLVFFLEVLNVAVQVVRELIIEKSGAGTVSLWLVYVFGFVNLLAKKFYEIGGESNVQEVLFLSGSTKFEWNDISEKVPDLPRGWFELSRISPEERIEFVCDLWLDRLPFRPATHASLTEFFSRLDDISIIIVKRDSEMQPEMVYSLSDNSSFFRGLPPCTEEDVRSFRSEISLSLPYDYLSFLRLHNGFGKLSERGILRIEDIPSTRQEVRNLLMNREKVIKWKGHNVSPDALIPFYEDYGLNSFQCFFSEWYPGSEMGNVYLSGINYTISDTTHRGFWGEQLAFPGFLEWLTDYLDGMSVSN